MGVLMLSKPPLLNEKGTRPELELLLSPLPLWPHPFEPEQRLKAIRISKNSLKK